MMSEQVSSSIPRSVEEWLTYIESLHPKSIEMGLARVNEVAKKMKLQYPFTVITVGGTNGKGSTCAMLESVYLAAGFRVGCYTSPHLVRYHERVRLNGAHISDQMLCEAFENVEMSRGNVPLTYFEMGTLAALWAFEQEPLDIVILEVGLGGRLDAVNIVNADCAIVTNVDLDHMEYLGDTRELIGREKAGIYRKHQIAVCGDPDPPASLITYAKDEQIRLHRFGIDYTIQPTLEDERAEYHDQQGSLEVDALKLFGPYQWNNAASVIFAIRSLNHKLPVNPEILLHSLTTTEVTGRFQYWKYQPDIILDVAHNPHAARALRSNLALLSKRNSQVIAVFSMLSDKDIVSVVKVLSDVVDIWEVAPINHPRAANIQYLTDCIQIASPDAVVNLHVDLPTALSGAYKKATKDDKIIVFGSFFTVAAILELSPQEFS